MADETTGDVTPEKTSTTPDEGDNSAKDGDGDQKQAADAIRAAAKESSNGDETKEGDGDQKAEGGDGDESTDKEGKDVAPDQYADFSLKEGFSLEGEKLTKFTEFARKMNLSQEAAQELVDYHMETYEEGQKLQQEAWKNTVEGWDAENKKKHGNELDKVYSLAKKGGDFIGASQVLDEYGLSHHPVFLEGLRKLGAILSEDTVKDTKTPAKLTMQERLDNVFSRDGNAKKS